MSLRLILFILFLVLPLHAGEDDFKNKAFTLNFASTSLQEGLSLIAQKSNLELELGNGVSGTLNFAFKNITMEKAVQLICKQKGLGYQVTDNKLRVFTLNPTPTNETISAKEVTNSSFSGIEIIKLEYISVKNVGSKVKPLLQEKESYVLDEVSNSIAVFGSHDTRKRVRSFIKAFDKMPQQILIEAQIVEVNKNFSRELGISWGQNLAENIEQSASDRTIIVSNPTSASANFTGRFKMGQTAGQDIYTKIIAAESNGEAKVISRPKIVTINNVPASINSGVTFSVKTLSSVSSSDTSGSSSTVTGGIQQINAGLELSVTPTIVGKSKVKLTINVTNNEADESTSVDGIPGINNNSAKTMIIVNNGETATMAGLIKNSHSESKGGVPWLKDLPLIGWLFRSSVKSNRDKELMIFITPKIIRI